PSSPLVFSHGLSFITSANVTVSQLSILQLLCNNFQRSNTATQGDFSHYMWSAERQIDGLTSRNAQLETSLACLEADVSQSIGRGGGVTRRLSTSRVLDV
ncbi:unnamed protein product, partial [Ectocarpus sp. 12 AP-2014]